MKDSTDYCILCGSELSKTEKFELTGFCSKQKCQDKANGLD
ncbi:hypothetical protein [Cellulophaga baltica]|nr:hypothetical protein [Cellulophaga baltica]